LLGQRSVGLETTDSFITSNIIQNTRWISCIKHRISLSYKKLFTVHMQNTSSTKKRIF